MPITLGTKSIYTVIRSLYGETVSKKIEESGIHVTIGSGLITMYDGDLMIGQGDLTMNTAMALVKKKLPAAVKQKVKNKLNSVFQDVLEYINEKSSVHTTKEQYGTFEEPSTYDYDDEGGLDKPPIHESNGIGGGLAIDIDESGNITPAASKDVYDLVDITSLGQKVKGTSPYSVYYSMVYGPGIKVAIRITSGLTVSIRVIEKHKTDILTSFGLSASSGYSSTHLNCTGKDDIVKLLGAFRAAIHTTYIKVDVLPIEDILKFNGVHS